MEIEITDERAELVTTAGLLNQNDKIREQIQQEEREKMRVRFTLRRAIQWFFAFAYGSAEIGGT